MTLNFYLPRGHFKSSVQSIRDIISFRIYDTYFHHNVRVHGTGVVLPRRMRVDFFFAIFLQIFFLFVSLSFHFPLYCTIISYFCFGLACSLRQAGFLKKDKVKVNFQNSHIMFVFFWHLKSFLCPPSMCFRTDTMSIQGHSTGTYKEISINRMWE